MRQLLGESYYTTRSHGTHRHTYSIPLIPPPSPSLCLSLMLCTVREGKSRRVLEEGVGGAAERERERAQQARGGGKGEAASGVSPDYNLADTEAGKTGAWRTKIKGHIFSFCVSYKE